ncbi:MAG TPA: HlyD family efflux transporter periplasmic adaptor subunit [Lutibacter sp.]|nr:HlyD family efflux transporter periplasmic adaptor subunit [Lutibacter sp.]
MKKLALLLLATFVFTSCDKEVIKADAYGNFEATEITVSAESNGKIIQLDLTEGESISKGKTIAQIDTIQLQLKKEQLEVAKSIIYTKSKGVLSQISVLKAQKETANTNKKRVEALIADNVGTQKQLDDVNGKISVINRQIRSIEIQNAGVVNEVKKLDAQIKEIEYQISKCKITNPVDGTVLIKYVEPNEIIGFGRPLYKIADMSEMLFKGYISEPQLANLKIGQEVTLKIDAPDGMKEYTGKISWIASQAEFTPKIIQTKEERVKLVYAIKIAVVNDGSLKIGMPGEMWVSN